MPPSCAGLKVRNLTGLSSRDFTESGAGATLTYQGPGAGHRRRVSAWAPPGAACRGAACRACRRISQDQWGFRLRILGFRVGSPKEPAAFFAQDQLKLLIDLSKLADRVPL